MELRQARAAITRYLAAYQLPSERILLRLDGQYGTGAVLSDLTGFAFVTGGKEYSALDHPLVQARLHLPPDQFQQRPESQLVRSLYDCPEGPVGPGGALCRVVVATHPAGKKKSPVGLTRAGIVYELFFTMLREPGIHRFRRALCCICIVEPSSRPWPMKIRRAPRIAGALTQPGDRSAGNWCRNGCGTSAWSWDISC